MNISEVCYEAACQMSRVENRHSFMHYSCNLVAAIETGKAWDGKARPPMSKAYAKLMTADPCAVMKAADNVGWPLQDFRTFMLLMASEAMTCSVEAPKGRV